MDYFNNTSSERKNKHLNDFERGQIELLNREDFSPYAIGKKLGRASNTIRNELKRGTVKQIKNNKDCEIYFPDVGRRVYNENRKNCGPKFKFLKCEEFINHVTSSFYIKNHSLDAICGASKLKKLFKPENMVSTKTLYNYIDYGLLEIKNIELPLKVRRNTKIKRVRKNKKILGTSIEDRPKEIDERKEFGHWEIDTVIGKKNKSEPVLLTLTERMTRKEIIRRIPGKSALDVQNCLEEFISKLDDNFQNIFKSITSDNGSEFSELASLEKSVPIKIYFAHPYCSSERGTNERHNGLIRRFIPKGKSLNDFSTQAIAKVELWCNNLPRKILNYLTPDEAFILNCESIL